MRYGCILLCLLFALSAFAQGLSIENLLSSPFPSNGVASRDVDQTAWVLNNRGHYNIWITQGPEYKLKQLTKYAKDDGQEISNLTISKAGDMVIYVRGGDPNQANEIPNPTSNPKGAQQQVWSIRTAGGEPVLIGEGSHPSLSPDGKTVAYVRGGKIYQAAADGSAKESPLIFARGNNDSPQWSPDGSKILFISYRNDHNFIGIHDVKQETIRWLAPSVDRDFAPIWSSDGHQVVFLRFPGGRGEPIKHNEPSSWFSIWVANAATGQAKEIWKSPDQTGGFAQLYADEPLRWGKDRIIFYWETDGWSRLYSIPVTGGTPVPLSPPSCEAETATLSNDRTRLIFSSNCNDIERRHLWSVPVEGGKAIQLTSGNGVETYPLQPANSKQIFFTSATAKRPAAVARIADSGGDIKILNPELLSHFPTDQLIEPEVVIFDSEDGWKIHGQLFRSKSSKVQKMPAVIYMHGGPIRQMLPAWHYMNYYHNAYAMNQYLAANGYVVLAVNFRCGIGYGRDFRRAPNQGPAGAAEYKDILAAAKYLQGLNDVDPQKIGLLGGSYGGYLTAMGLARDSKLFAAGVDLHGVHDWSLRAKLRGGEDWGIVGDESMKLAFESSPVGAVENWSSPVLFIIGDDDRNVDFIETTDLVQRLRDWNKAHIEMLILPDEVHGFLRYQSWIDVYKSTFDFLERFLKKGMANVEK